MSVALFDLSGKVAVVTGTGGGIGRAIAKRLDAAGAQAVLCDRTANIVEMAAAEIRNTGAQARAIQADARNRSDVKRVIDGAVETFG